MDQSQRPRYVSRFEHLALHPRLHHRVGFPIHYLPPREPPPRRICYNNRSTELLSQTPPHNRGVGLQPNNNQHLYRRGFTNQTPPLTRRSKPQASTSTKEGANTNPIQQPQPLPKREHHKKSRVYNQWYVSTTNLKITQRGGEQVMANLMVT